MSLPPNLGPRNGILSLTHKDKSVLYAAYMPFDTKWRIVHSDQQELQAWR